MSRRSRLRRSSGNGTPKKVAGVLIAIAAAGLLALAALVVLALVIGGSWLKDLPDIDSPDAFSVSQTTKIYSADNKLLANLYLENRRVVGIEDISPHMQKAIIAVEDQRFYEHNGVDYVGIFRAAITNLASGGVAEGASTLTQQYIRNTVLADERNDISLRRKVREAYLALQLEKRWSKEEILAQYLNTVYFGDGAYGVEAASMTYFGVHAKDLTITQSALLAGLPQQPSRLSPFSNPDGALARRTWVLSKMKQQGYITTAQYDTAKANKLKLTTVRDTAEQGVYSAPYFVAYVKKALQDAYGSTLVYRGGLTVHTTLDTSTQSAAEKACKEALNRSDDPSYALVAIDPSSGAVKAMVGGKDWEKKKFNYATQALRQPGSSFKMFTLVTALSEGIPPTRRFNSSSPAVIPTSSKPWVVTGGSRGYISLRQATVGSVNVVFARLIAEIGAAPVVKTAKKMGITTDVKPYLSITLGSEEVTPLEMASSYATLAANGKHYPTTGITEITDAAGKSIYTSKSKATQAISASVAYATTQILEGVISGGTGTSANIGRPAAGKTGTTQDYRDAWFCGYTPQLACAVWVGYSQEKPMTSVHGRTVYGGTFPAEIWAAFMRSALSKQPKTDFTPVKAPTYTWKNDWTEPLLSVPSVTGVRLSSAKSTLQRAGFNVSVAEVYSTSVPSGRVINQSPAAGSKLASGKTVNIVVSIGKKSVAPAPTPEPTSSPPASGTP